MDQKLLLKEKDYELLNEKRQIVPKHSFHDPLINPPKIKTKKGANIKTIKESKPVGILGNNILERRGTKGIKSSQSGAIKNVLEEEID